MYEYKTIIEALKNFGGQDFNVWTERDYEHQRDNIVLGKMNYGESRFRSSRESTEGYMPCIQTLVNHGCIEIKSRSRVLTKEGRTIRNFLYAFDADDALKKELEESSHYHRTALTYGKVLTVDEFIEKEHEELDKLLRGFADTKPKKSKSTR